MPTAKKKPSKTSAAPTWEEKVKRLKSRPPAEQFVTIPDEESVIAADAARTAWLEARRDARLEAMRADESHSPSEDDLDTHPKVSAAHRAYEEAVTAAEDAALVLHFRQLPPDVYDTFQTQHPATPDQEAQGMSFNPDTYLPALMAACSVEDLDMESAAALVCGVRDEDGVMVEPPAFNQGETAMIFRALVEVNERPRMVLGKGLRPTSG